MDKEIGPNTTPTSTVYGTTDNRNWSYSHFEFQHQVHPLLAKRVDVIEDESDDDVNAIALMSGNTILKKKRVT